MVKLKPFIKWAGGNGWGDYLIFPWGDGREKI